MSGKNSIRLISVLVSFILISCSPTEMQRQFEMERAINLANRQKQQFYLSGGELDSAEYEILKKSYTAITEMITPPPKDPAAIDKTSEPLMTSWQMAGLAYYNLGLLNMERENLDGAYDDFERLIERYGFKPHQVQTALFMQALVRFKQDRFREAVLLYNAVAQYYLESAKPELNPNLDALDSPLTAARILRDMENENQFDYQLNRAIDYYWGILNSHHGTPLGNAAVGKLASAFLLGELADSAVVVLSQVKDPETGKIPPLVLYNIANIQRNNLLDFGGAEKSYRQFVAEYSEHPLRASAQFGIAASLFANKKYPMARDEVSKVEKLIGVPRKILAEASYLKALAYQMEDNWPRALGEFGYVSANFPVSRRGMEIPLHVAAYYRSIGESRLAIEALAEAEKVYRRLMDVYSARRDIVARAMSYLAASLIERELWEDALEVLKTLASKYPETPEGYSAGPAAADILTDRLKRPADAAATLRVFVNNYPGSMDIENIMAYADSLETLTR
ncbi:MAG: tetratricopeptide repeat protein [candidate division Zixibacteria bacterium]